MEIQEMTSPKKVEAMNRRSVNALFRKGRDAERGLVIPYAYIDLLSKYAPGKRLLDIGCGRGRYIGEFLKLGFEYTGIDISEGALARARHAHPSLTFERMSYRNLKFPDNSFDCGWCCCSLNYSTKDAVHQALLEIRRVTNTCIILLPDPQRSQELVHQFEGRNLYHSSWFYEEFTEILEKLGFDIIYKASIEWHSVMSFVVKKSEPPTPP